jgi:fibronectin type 3 domain-containing protein
MSNTMCNQPEHIVLANNLVLSLFEEGEDNLYRLSNMNQFAEDCQYAVSVLRDENVHEITDADDDLVARYGVTELANGAMNAMLYSGTQISEMFAETLLMNGVNSDLALVESLEFACGKAQALYDSLKEASIAS